MSIPKTFYQHSTENVLSEVNENGESLALIFSPINVE
jgi:hypothetical protein